MMGLDGSTDFEDVQITCSRCGSKAKINQKFCAKCGNLLDDTASPHFAVSNQGQGQSYQQAPVYQAPPQNTYQVPQQSYQQAPVYQAPPQNTYQVPQQNFAQQQYQNAGVNQGQADRDIIDLIGTNIDIYLNKFAKINQHGPASSWNWCAFLSAPCWFAYRKMYHISALYLITLIFSAINAIFGSILILAVSIFAGIYGDNYYKGRIEKHAMTAKMMNFNDKAMYIAKNGGVSVPAVLIYIAASILLSLIVNSAI